MTACLLVCLSACLYVMCVVYDIDSYQRILHRNLMEMANYIDSTFGVYGTAPPNTAFTSDTNADETAQVHHQRCSAPLRIAFIQRTLILSSVT